MKGLRALKSGRGEITSNAEAHLGTGNSSVGSARAWYDNRLTDTAHARSGVKGGYRRDWRARGYGSKGSVPLGVHDLHEVVGSGYSDRSLVRTHHNDEEGVNDGDTHHHDEGYTLDDTGVDHDGRNRRLRDSLDEMLVNGNDDGRYEEPHPASARVKKGLWGGGWDSKHQLYTERWNL